VKQVGEELGVGYVLRAVCAERAERKHHRAAQRRRQRPHVVPTATTAMLPTCSPCRDEINEAIVAAIEPPALCGGKFRIPGAKDAEHPRWLGSGDAASLS